MQKIKRFVPIVLLIVWDVVCVAASITLAFRLRYPAVGGIPPYQAELFNLIILTFALVHVALSALCGCYNGIWRHIGLGDVARQLLAVFLSGVACYAADRLLRFQIHWTVFIIMSSFLFLLTIFGRVFTKLLSMVQAKVLNVPREEQRRILIFGAGEAGAYLKNKLDRHPEDHMKPVVFIDDNVSLHHKRIHGLRVYGGMDKLDEAIRRYAVDEVVVAVPTAENELLQRILGVCRDNHCKMRRFGRIDDVDLSAAKVSNINFEDLLHRSSVHLNMQTVRDFVQDKVVMVTGGAGSIGSEICRQVLSFGCKTLIIFDINENGLFFIDNELKETYGTDRHILKLGSVRDRARLSEVMTEYQPSIVFHAAAHKHVPMMEINPKEAIKNNVFGTINVAQAAIQHQVEKFILISTDKAVNPTNIMGASKRIAEKCIQMLDNVSDTDFAAVRFGNVLGSNGSVVPFFQKQISEGGPVTVTHPDMRRYFMTIPEAVQLVLEAGAMARGGEIFVLDMGQPVRIYDLACDLIRLSGYEPNVDIQVVFTGLRPGEKLFEEISLAEEDVDTTANSKIVVLKPIPYDMHQLAADVKALEATIPDETCGRMFDLVQKIVPTFVHKQAETGSDA